MTPGLGYVREGIAHSVNDPDLRMRPLPPRAAKQPRRTVSIIPDFMRETLKANKFDIGADVALVYENGTGGLHRVIVGTVVYPPGEDNSGTVDSLDGQTTWIFPKSKADGSPAQSDIRASLLRVNNRFVIETGTVFHAADYQEDEDASEEKE